MCQSCDPGLLTIARAVVPEIDLESVETLEKPTSTPSNSVGDDEPPCMIFTGGPILTMAGGKFSPVEAIAIKRGIIEAVGSLVDVQYAAGKEAAPINLGNRCMLPGFVEPHVHMQLSALSKHYLQNLSPLTVTTFDEALDVLRTAANKTPQGEWVLGYGYDPSRITPGHPVLYATDLDRVAEKHQNPVFVLNQSGHLAYVNHVAFKLAHIDDSIKDPHYEKDSDGKLTGVVVDTAAMGPFIALFKQPDAQCLVSWCKETLQLWASSGCTTVFDAGLGTASAKPEADVDLVTAVTKDQCPVRFTGAMTVEAASIILGGRKRPWKPPYMAGHARLASIKVWLDGSTQGFTAALRENYLGVNTRGPLTHADDSELHDIMFPWVDAGWQLLVHSNGDRATDQALSVYAAVLSEATHRDPNIQHRIEHFTVTHPEQLATAKALGLGVSHTMLHVYYWGKTFRDYVLGTPRAELIDPVAEDVANGLVFSFHSDSPLTDPNPLLYVHTAVTREMYNDPAVLGPDQCVDLETAFLGITINAAKHVMMEETIGSLEKGKSADFVILDKDPRSVSRSSVKDIGIYQTWLEGRMTYSIPQAADGP